jgi:predicted alpha/beta hydrolase
MALQELGVATDIVTTAFAILFGAIALALALAFGLGNRELAGEVMREWYDHYRQERDDAIARERAADAEEEEEFDDEFGSGDDDEPSQPPPPATPGPVGA